MPQFPSSFSFYSDLDPDSYFPDALLYLHHKDTGVLFLADTGSVVNIIRDEVLSKYYPEADKSKIPYRIPLKGIGGSTLITHFTFIKFSNDIVIPFCTGLSIPIECIGLHWIERTLSSISIEPKMMNPRVLENKICAVMKLEAQTTQREEAGRALQTDPVNSATAEPRAKSGGHNTPVATVGQDNQEAGRALNDPSREAGRALNGPSEEFAQIDIRELDSPMSPLVPNLTSSGLIHQEGDAATISDYHIAQGEKNPEALLVKLRQTRLDILQKPSEPPPRNLHADDNTIIAKSLWEPVYRPYAGILEDIENNLRMPSLLTYQCTVTLLNPLAEPCVVSAYQIRSEEQRNALEENIDKFLNLGVMEEGPAVWYTPLFVVPQKVNAEQKALDPRAQRWRVVQNFQPLNSQVVKEENTLPTIEDVLSLGEGGKKVFSNIDIKSAFYHVDIKKSDRSFFGISHAFRKIRMRKMGMGFTNSPSIWQRNMNVDVEKPVRDAYIATLSTHDRLNPHATNVIKIYMDDILLATSTAEQHLILLRILFERLSQLRLTLSIGKSFIGKKEINILGSTLSANMRRVQPERIHALGLFAPPQTIFELRHFLGGIRYISDHVPLLNLLLRNFDSQVGGTPARLSKSTPFLWTWTLYDDFMRIHKVIQNPEVLFQIDSTLPLYLETDASELGFGAILFQQEDDNVLPIAYYAKKWQSPTMKGAQANPSTTARRELKALQCSILHFNKILMNRPFHIITDNMCVFHQVKNATRADKPKMPTDIVAHRSLEAILLYPISSITHRTSKEVFTSDGLSRMAWMEISPEPNDRTAWPVMPVQRDPQWETASRHLVRHFRHERCNNMHKNMHSYITCVLPMLQEYAIDLSSFQEDICQGNSERIFSTPFGWNAYVGHSIGISPVYTLYMTPNVLLTHWTKPSNIPSIKRGGLLPMSRKYIHFKNNGPLTRGRTYPVRVDTSSLLDIDIKIYSITIQNNTAVYLVPGAIPSTLLIF